MLEMSKPHCRFRHNQLLKLPGASEMTLDHVCMCLAQYQGLERGLGHDDLERLLHFQLPPSFS